MPDRRTSPVDTLFARDCGGGEASVLYADSLPAVERVSSSVQLIPIPTLAVAEHYAAFDKVITLNGLGQIDGIFSSLCKEIDARA